MLKSRRIGTRLAMLGMILDFEGDRHTHITRVYTQAYIGMLIVVGIEFLIAFHTHCAYLVTNKFYLC